MGEIRDFVSVDGSVIDQRQAHETPCHAPESPIRCNSTILSSAQQSSSNLHEPGSDVHSSPVHAAAELPSLHLVVARHCEDLTWLLGFLEEHPDCTATVYNDGPPCDDVPEELVGRLSIRVGDGVPSEPTKYMAFMLEHWEDCAEDAPGAKPRQRLVFTQADPFTHSPDFMRLLEARDEWDSSYQNLTLWAYPPPWGGELIARILVGRAGAEDGVRIFSNGARVWSDGPMDDEFRGTRFWDPWLKELRGLTGGTTLGDVWHTLLGFATPPPPADKTYAATFATDWATLRSFGRERWACLHDYVLHGDERVSPGSTQKARSVLLEYMWSLCLWVPWSLAGCG